MGVATPEIVKACAFRINCLSFRFHPVATHITTKCVITKSINDKKLHCLEGTIWDGFSGDMPRFSTICDTPGKFKSFYNTHLELLYQTVVKFGAVDKLVKYLREVRIELGKVIWPKREEVIKLTSVVFIISAVVGAYLGGLDLMFTKLLTYIIAE